jgi:hypothetical protein
VLARALAQGVFQPAWAMILLKQISERLIRKFLKVLHGVMGKKMQSLPRVRIEAEQLALIGRISWVIYLSPLVPTW